MTRPTILNGKSKIESTILTRLSHPNIVKIYDEVIDKDKMVKIFEELAIGGDLFSYLCTSEEYLSPLSEAEVVFCVYQITGALNYLHKKGVVHRDLKLDNILVMDVPIKYPHLVLADFGVAKQNLPLTQSQLVNFSQATNLTYLDEDNIKKEKFHLNDNNNRKSFWMSTMVGTAEYAAPEIDLLSKHKHKHKRNGTGDDSRAVKKRYTEKVDTWSLGVITFILLTGTSPFYSSDIEKTVLKAKEGILHMDKGRWSQVGPEAKEFVSCCLNISVEKRWNIEECLKSSMFNIRSRKLIIKKLIKQKGMEI